MWADVKWFVEACSECQTTKYSTQKPAGLLQPLPVPSQVWEDVSMDIITSLPQSRGYTTILVAVDRLSKYAHFAPLPSRFDAWRVANLFIDTVVKHHGFPKTLVSDCDPLFLNEVWEHMLNLSGTKQHFTTAYHPKSDGQTKVRNRWLEQYLRAFVADKPSKLANFLPWGISIELLLSQGLRDFPVSCSIWSGAVRANSSASVRSYTARCGKIHQVEGRINCRTSEESGNRMHAAANRHR